VIIEVGTRLYIAPEVQSRKRGPRDHNKADLYSLGVGFILVRMVLFIMSFTDCVFRDELLLLDGIRTNCCNRGSEEARDNLPSRMGSSANPAAAEYAIVRFDNQFILIFP
jgi:serine/threonine protein kinase